MNEYKNIKERVNGFSVLQVIRGWRKWNIYERKQTQDSNEKVGCFEK